MTLTVTDLTIDIGDGRGPQPMPEMPRLGEFETDWVFDWRKQDGKNEGVRIEVAVPVPGVG